MKKAPNVRLSLRKLILATLAVGPLAVLPSPIWAVLPTYNASTNTGSFTVVNGTASVTPSGTIATISTSDKAVLNWGNNTTGAPYVGVGITETVTNFNIENGQTYQFIVPTGGAVLNRVKAGNVTAVNNATYSGVAAFVGATGTLLSNGKVFILSDNGSIMLQSGATVNTQGGLVLSTLAEGSDGPFITLGDLTYQGASNGNISIGTGTVSGSLAAYAGTISSAASTSVAGDLVLRSVTSGSAINLGGSGITGNLTVTTNDGAITDTGAVTVGATGGTQATTLSSGTGSIALDNIGNDFKVVTAMTSGTADVTLVDKNIITLGASTVGRNLMVTAGGAAGANGIATSGAVAVGGNADFRVVDSNVSGVSFQNGSSIVGTVNATTWGGAITINTTGALTVGTVRQQSVGAGASQALAGGAGGITVGLNDAIVATGGAGYVTAPTVVISAPPAGDRQATARAVLTNGVVTDIVVDDAGAGYTSLPTVAINDAGSGGAGATTGAVYVGILTANVTTTSGTNSTTFASPGVYGAAPAITFEAVTAGQSETIATGNVVALHASSGTGALTTGSITMLTGGNYTNLPTTITVATPLTSGAITLRSSGALTIAGAVTGANSTSTPNITATGGNVSFGAAGSISAGGIATINSTAGDVVLGAVTANRITSASVGGNITQNAGTILTTSAGTATTNTTFSSGIGIITLDNLNSFGSVSPIQLSGNDIIIRNINNSVIGTTTTTGNLTINGGGANTSVVLGTGSGAGVGQNLTVNGLLTVAATGTGTITDNDYSTFNLLGGVNLTSGSGAITLDAANALATLSPRTSYGAVNGSTTGAFTIVETTTLNLGNITAGSLTATSVQGGIVDTGPITITTGGSVSLTANATQSVVLDNATNVLSNLSFGGGVNNSVTNLNSNVSIAGTTTASGNITIGTNAGRWISLGTSTINGNLTLMSGGGIDISGFANITGNLSLISTGNFTATATADGVLAGAVTGVTVTHPTAGLNATLTYAAAPTVTIAAPDTPGTQATATAAINATGNLTGVTVAPGSLGYTVIPTVTIGSSATGITQSAGTLVVTGNTTVKATGDVNLFRGNDFSNVVVDSSSRDVIVNDINGLSISGNATGNITATAGGVGTAGGPARIANAWALSLGNIIAGGLIAVAQNGGGGSSGTVSQQTGSRIHAANLARFTTTNANIIIGNNFNNFGRVEVNNLAATTGNVTRSITVTEDATMRVGVVNNTWGTTNLTSRTGSILEDTGADVTLTSNGTLSANSTTGSVMLGNTTHTVGNTTGNVSAFTANAPGGAVAIRTSAGNGNLALGNITALSLSVNAGNVTSVTGNISQADGARLNIYGSSNFTAIAGINLTGTGSAANNFGRLSLVSTNPGSNITVTENGTLNLGTVSMGTPGSAAVGITPAINANAGNGTFTATSLTGDIVDTGLGGVRLGGVVASSAAPNFVGANPAIIGTGVVTLSAVNGNIELNDVTTEFQTSGGVVFNPTGVVANGNVTLSPLGRATVVLGAPNTTSFATNLSVVSATGNVTNNGNVVASGDAYFQTGTGDITLTSSGNRFATVRFEGKDVRITQLNDINIVTGSSARGLAEFVSQSYIEITPKGGIVDFKSTANFTAAGTITLPKLLQSVGTITVNSPSLKNLSALSIVTDLANKAPINLGLGEYRKPFDAP